jgi:pilus assembly protein Flp/PilA
LREGPNPFGLSLLTSSWRTKTMSRLVPFVSRFLASDDGPTAVEYAVMLALILVTCIGIVTTLGTSISSTFDTVNTSMSGS